LKASGLAVVAGQQYSKAVVLVALPVYD